MIYGIGTKALGEQLGIDENEASVFVETFKAKYPGTDNEQIEFSAVPTTVQILLCVIQCATKGLFWLFWIFAGMRRFMQECVTRCRERGFVETITGRRRYLPAIRDSNVFARSHVSALAKSRRSK